MTPYICVTCGTQFAPTAGPPPTCPICADPRQYIGPGGQQWTTLAALQETRRIAIRELEPGLSGVGAEPEFAIGQRALLLQSPGGNVLWDCLSVIDETAVAAINALGGIRAIAISHPHFYSSMIAWAEAFAAPILLHAANRRWVMRPDARIRYWDEDAHTLWDGLTLLRAGGHFTGSTVLHWPGGADGRGALLTGDTITVVSDRRYVSFMRSYPNLIPLPAATVAAIAAAVAPYPFERLYGGWWGKVIDTDAQAAVQRSAARYIAALEAPPA